MPLGGFGRDFKKQVPAKKEKVEFIRFDDEVKVKLDSLQEQLNKINKEIGNLKQDLDLNGESLKRIISRIEDFQKPLQQTIGSLGEEIKSLGNNQALLSLGTHKALTEATNLLDLKFEELKETQVEVDYKAINLQFKNLQTILTQQKLNIQLLTNELEKRSPWIPVLIGCAIGLSGVLGYVVSLI